MPEPIHLFPFNVKHSLKNQVQPNHGFTQMNCKGDSIPEESSSSHPRVPGWLEVCSGDQDSNLGPPAYPQPNLATETSWYENRYSWRKITKRLSNLFLRVNCKIARLIVNRKIAGWLLFAKVPRLMVNCKIARLIVNCKIAGWLLITKWIVKCKVSRLLTKSHG